MIKSAEEFVRLRSSYEPGEYRRAASESSPMEVWLDVVERFPDMRRWVAHNKSVPLEVLVILAHDSDPDVRMSVAMKNKLTVELFDLLARDVDASVRQRVACNKNVPLALLASLAEDIDSTVAEAARLRLQRRRQ